MTVGVIDTGKNTFHLLIAERSGNLTQVLHEEKVAVRLGKEGIDDEAVKRTIEVLLDFKVQSKNGVWRI